MIGVFDSGVGGLTALSELRKLLPRADIIYLADRENAPYGTKGEEELSRLVKSDIDRLLDMGAEKILVACCTASTVIHLLPQYANDAAIPIIEPAARAAASLAENGRIAVIATKRTVSSHAFRRSAQKLGDFCVCEWEAQRLVSLVESGERDGSLSPEASKYLDELLYPIREYAPDALILGCTHFPHLEAEIGARLPKVKLINPSREGAIALAGCYAPRGEGRTIFL